MAKEYGIQTIAEYVESEESLTAVSSLDIDFAQGYHTDKPSPEFMEPVGFIQRGITI